MCLFDHNDKKRGKKKNDKSRTEEEREIIQIQISYHVSV